MDSAPASAGPYVPPTFQGWIYNYFGFNPSPTVAGDTATPAGDGVPNLIKYALGLNPMVGCSGTSQGMPSTQVAASDSNGYLALTFSGTATGVAYIVEATCNLTSGWNPLQTWPVGSPPGTVTVTDTAAISCTPERFIRLRVTRP